MKNSILFLFLSFIFLIGCGPSGSCDSDTSITQTSNPTLEIIVERGPVYGSIVKDKNGNVATNIVGTNKYKFDISPTYPITASGGYIDVDNNQIFDTNDVKLEQNLSSYYPIITPITTLIGNDSEKLKTLAKLFNIDEPNLIKIVPSKLSNEAIVLNNIAYKAIATNTELNTSTGAPFLTIVNEINTTYEQTYSANTKEQLAINLEQYLIDNDSDLNFTKLIQSDIDYISNTFAKTLELNNSLFEHNTSTNDSLADIWNLNLSIPQNQNKTFNLGLRLIKDTITVDIYISDLKINNNIIDKTNSSINFFAFKEGQGGTTQKFDSSKEITKNSIQIFQNMFIINLSYIIEYFTNENSNVIDIASFKNPNSFEVSILCDTLDINGTTTTQTKQLIEKISAWDRDLNPIYSYYNFPIGSQEINGTINIQ